MTSATYERAVELDRKLVVSNRNLENLENYYNDAHWDTNESVTITLGFPGIPNYLFLEITKEDVKAMINYYLGEHTALELEFEEL